MARVYEIYDLHDEYFIGKVSIVANGDEEAVKEICLYFTGTVDEIIRGKISVSCGGFCTFSDGIRLGDAA